MLHDVRLAIRRFWFKPLHTAIVVSIVGVGLGAATAVFSVVDQLILRPAPFAEPSRLVSVMDLFRAAGARSTNLTLEKIAGWREQPALFEAFEGYTFRRVDVTGDGGEPERVNGLVVTDGLFRLLGVQPSLGRGLGPDDGRPGAEPVVLISDGFWKRRFGGRTDALGSRLALSDEPHTVVGVMPRRFRIHGEDEDLWLPVRAAGGGGTLPGGFVGLARLARGVDVASAQGIADRIAARLQAETPLPSAPFWDIHVEKKKVASVAATTRTALFVLLGAVGFVLLITCANTASLLLSQIDVRQRESAIRAAIGASRRRLFREVLTESVLLAGLGGAVGILLATWGVEAIVAAAPPNLAFNPTSPIEVDLRILLVAIGLTLATGVVFGLTPAWRGARPHVEAILKSGADGGRGGTAQGGLAGALLVAEVAFSLILLIGAALMVRTFVNLHALSPGFDANGAIAISLSLPTDKYAGAGARSAFFQSLAERVAGLPGVTHAASAAHVFTGAGISFVTVDEIEGRGPGAASGSLAVPRNTVSPEYFQAMGIPLLAGRSFADADDPDAIVVSRSLAERLWPGGDALGRRFRFAAGWPWHTVVGVAGDVEPRSGGEAESPFQLYGRFPPPSAAAAPPPRVRGYAERVLIVRAADPAAVVPAIRGAVWTLDPNQPVGRVDLVSDLYADAFGRERFVLQLMTAFGLIAVGLTAAGIFGVLAQVVARRTREIGVRVALGARGTDIVRLVATRGIVLVIAGAALGLAGAMAVSRSLEALLFQVRPIDPVSFAAVALLMVLIAVAACWLPVRRAIRLDPAAALRVE